MDEKDCALGVKFLFVVLVFYLMVEIVLWMKKIVRWM